MPLIDKQLLIIVVVYIVERLIILYCISRFVFTFY